MYHVHQFEYLSTGTVPKLAEGHHLGGGGVLYQEWMIHYGPNVRYSRGHAHVFYCRVLNQGGAVLFHSTAHTVESAGTNLQTRCITRHVLFFLSFSPNSSLRDSFFSGGVVRDSHVRRM